MERVYLDREELVQSLVDDAMVHNISCRDLDRDVILIRTASNLEFACNKVDVMSMDKFGLRVMDGTPRMSGLKSDYEAVRDAVVKMIYGGKASKKSGVTKICLSVANDLDIKTALEFKKLA